MTYRIVYEDVTMCVATSGRAFINAWFKSPDTVMLRRLGEHHRTFVKHISAGRHAVVSLIEADIGRTLEESAREEARTQAQEMIPLTYCHGFIVLGTGFYAASVRSIIAGVQWFSRTPVPWKVFSDVPSGARWIAERGDAEGFPESAAALQGAIDAAQHAGKRLVQAK